MKYIEKQRIINEMIERLQNIQEKNYAFHHQVEYQIRDIEETLRDLHEKVDYETRENHA